MRYSSNCYDVEIAQLDVGHVVIVDLRINETLQPGAVRKTKLPFYRLVTAVSNCAYAVRLETAPTGG